jgi:hypothetical protein
MYHQRQQYSHRSSGVSFHHATPTQIDWYIQLIVEAELQRKLTEDINETHSILANACAGTYEHPLLHALLTLFSY